MTDDQLRTDANSREQALDHQYSLSVEQTADHYANAGHPRTIRAIQKYCALSKLDCHKVETETGEKYLVAPYSVARHLSYINEVGTVATNRDHARIDASIRLLETNDVSMGETAATSPEQSRMDTFVRARD